MAILVPSPPEGSLTALREALGSLAARGQLDARVLKRARPEQLTATAPHQVFTLGLTDLVNAPHLGAARPSGWRYLVEADNRVVAAAETNQQGAQKHAFAHLNYGPFVGGTVDALAAAEPLAAKSDYELRVLHVPALYVMALWLKPVNAGDGEGILIPLAPTPTGIESARAYPASELLVTLAQRARAVPALTADDQRGGT